MSSDDTPALTPRERSNANLAPAWKPGQSGNPAGRPKGARSKLSEDFFQALHDDFEEHGAQAIISMRTEKPNEYAKMIAGLQTKQEDVKVKADISDEAKAWLGR